MHHIPTIQAYYYMARDVFSEGYRIYIFGYNKECYATEHQFSRTKFDYCALPKNCQNSSEFESEKMVKIANVFEILKVRFV